MRVVSLDQTSKSTPGRWRRDRREELYGSHQGFLVAIEKGQTIGEFDQGDIAVLRSTGQETTLVFVAQTRDRLFTDFHSQCGLILLEEQIPDLNRTYTEELLLLLKTSLSSLPSVFEVTKTPGRVGDQCPPVRYSRFGLKEEVLPLIFQQRLDWTWWKGSNHLELLPTRCVLSNHRRKERFY